MAVNSLLYNAHVWTTLSVAQEENLSNEYVGVFRMAIGMPFNNPTKTRYRDEDVLAEAGKITVQGKLCVA
eukprot:3892614-Karenia_brevis.AAC.1